MPETGFPSDDYTPHGYLANPYAVAHSWSEGAGGCLRTTREHVGMGWQFPWALRAQASVDLVIALEGDGTQLVTRADFDAAGLTSPHHSANLFVYRWQAFGQSWDASFVLTDEERLGIDLEWSPLPSMTDQTAPGPIRLTVGLIGWRNGDIEATILEAGAQRVQIDLGEPYEAFFLWGDNAWIARPGIPLGRGGPVRVPDATPAPWLAQAPGSVAVAWSLDLIATIGRQRVCGIVRRVRAPDGPWASASVTHTVGSAIGRARTADNAFWDSATRLEGDWPTSWRRGWVYDTETTRMCVYPPGGIFTDVWPAWMIQWPRAVVAEGTLDMARFAYASPDLAQRAVLSLFRDAQTPNVPCVFQHGEPNMVANDGSVCGTSPAWCIPFYNLERLFKLTLDRGWLAGIYPYLVAYVEWWLAERTDSDGWAVYKCTWEAGEDDTPRLDPERRGDNVVSKFVLPVELQATMALSAGVLSRFARALGKPVDAARWQQVEAAYLERTRQLWDASVGRFRDWDARNSRFLPPAGEANYWGIDVCRYSALAFTPLLAGISDEAVRDGLRAELQAYDGPPWTLWASWSYVVLEAAPLTGDTAFAGRVAAEIVGRVYGELDARQIAGPNHPTPGIAREFWPLELDTWASCEGYGWGANTASLLVQQVFGFVEGPYLDEMGGVPESPPPTNEGGWRASVLHFELRPSLPAHLLVPGKQYQLTHVPYRGARLSLGYRIGKAGALTILVEADRATHCQLMNLATGEQRESATAQPRHEIGGRNGGRFAVKLTPIAV